MLTDTELYDICTRHTHKHSKRVKMSYEDILSTAFVVAVKCNNKIRRNPEKFASSLKERNYILKALNNNILNLKDSNNRYYRRMNEYSSTEVTGVGTYTKTISGGTDEI